MIYPNNYEFKIGFDTIRHLLKEHCVSTLGKEKVDELSFSDDATVVNEQMAQIREFRRLMQATEKPEMNYFFDVRESVARIRMENTHLEEDELFDLRRSLETIGKIVDFLNRGEKLEARGESYPYPALHRLAEDVQTFPASVTTWNRRQAAFRVPYILYCTRHSATDWWHKMLHPRCATVD